MRLIDADAYIAKFGHIPIIQDAISKSLDSMPTIEERKPGKWVKWGNRYKCNQCNLTNEYKKSFCPNCGADMRGGKK